MMFCLRFFGIALLWAAASPLLFGQVDVNCNSLVYEQNFNSLPGGANTCSATGNFGWVDNSTLPGWFALATNPSNFAANVSNGSCNTRGIYSYGSTSSADRALGLLGAVSTNFAVSVRFVNTTGRTIRSLRVRYTGEVWRRGDTNSETGLLVSYQLNVSNLSLVATRVPQLDFNTPATVTGTNVAVDGNLPANRGQVEHEIVVDIRAGESIILRWLAEDNPGADDGHGIDDLRVEFTIDPPVTITEINGPAIGCPTAGNQSYTALPNTAGQTYTWTMSAGGPSVPATGNPVSINWQDVPPGTYTLTVTPNNGCADGTPFTRSFTLNPLPQPATLTGPSNVAIGSTRSFSATGGNASTTYTWTIDPALPTFGTPRTGLTLNIDFTGAAAGSYTLRLVASTACETLEAVTQVINVAAAGTLPIELNCQQPTYAQNFDQITPTNNAGCSGPGNINWINNNTVPGWYRELAKGPNDYFIASSGGCNTGSTYSFGANNAGERALGTIQSGNHESTFGAWFENATGKAITSLEVRYVGEQWRRGKAPAGVADTLFFEYSLSATGLLTPATGWVRVPQLHFASPNTANFANGQALNGNAAENRRNLAHTIANLNIPAGARFWVRWIDFNVTDEDDGLAVDEFQLTAFVQSPPALDNVTGPRESCPVAQTYTVANPAAGIDYAWNIDPPVPGFVNGTTGASQTLPWANVSPPYPKTFRVSVTPEDACGTGPVFTYDVVVVGPPTITSSNLPTTVQQGSQVEFSVVVNPPTAQVNWLAPKVFNAPQTGNPASINFNNVAARRYPLRATASNACGKSAPTQVAIRVQSASTETPRTCQPEFTWSRFMPSAGVDNANGVATDGDGNVYVTGSFSNAINFENLTLNTTGGDDVFLIKYSPQGELLWARSAGGPGADIANRVVVDANYNATIVGNFSGTCVFGTTNLVSAGDTDFFVAQYDRDGNLRWAKRGGGTGSDIATSVDVDASGSFVYVVGQMSQGANYDSNALNTVAGGSNGYVLYLNAANGNYVTHNRIGGVGNAVVHDISVGPLGELYVIGNFSDRVRLDFVAPTQFRDIDAVGDESIFVAKYAENNTAELQWVEVLGGSASDYGIAIAAGPTTDVYIAGYLSSLSTSFGALPPLTTTGSSQIFIARLNDEATLTYAWARSAGSANEPDFAADLAVDLVSEEVYLVGAVSPNPTFGPPNQVVTAPAELTGYVAKYGMVSGTVDWVVPVGQTGFNLINGVALDETGRIYVAGSVQNATFACRNYEQINFGDGFVAQLTCPVAPLAASASSSAVTTPGGNNGSITASATGGGGTRHEFQLDNGPFQTSGVFPGLTAGTYRVTVRGVNRCSQTLEVQVLEDVPCETPTNLSTENVQAGSVDLRWTAVPNAIGYRIEYTNLTTSQTQTFEVNTGTPTFPVRLTPLSSSTAYRITVQAVCGVQESGKSLPVEVSTPAGCDLPLLQVASTGLSTARITWNATAADVRFEGEIKTAAEPNWGGSFQTTELERSFTGLLPTTEYQVRVRRVCTDGTSDYTIVNFTTAACTAPSGITTSFTATGIRVRWTALEGAIGYEVGYRLQNEANFIDLPPVTANEALIPNVQPNQTYVIRVRTRCSDTQNSPYATLNVAVPRCSTPAVTALPVAGALRVAWVPVFGAVAYEIQFRPLNTVLWSGIITTTDTFRLYTGLAANTTYEFRVRAVCVPSVEFSGYGTASFALAACDVPTGLTVCGLNPVRVRWTAVPNAEGYQISYRPVNRTTWTLADVSQPSANLAGSFNQTPYVVRVRTVCAGGAVSAYTEVVQSSDCPSTCPTPGNLRLNDFLLTGRQAEVLWDAATDAVSYEVRVRDVLNGNWVSFFTTDQNYLLTALSPNTRYEVQVRSICEGNELSPWTSSLLFRTPTGGCITPEDFRLSARTDTTLTFTWTTQIGVLNYEIRWQAVGDQVWQSRTVAQPPLELRNLLPGQPYLVSIRSLCPLSDVSTFSPPLEVIPQGNCQPPTTLSALVPSKTEANLEWNAVAGAQAYIVQYRLLGETEWTSFQVPTNRATLNFLAPDTTYEYSIVTVCGTNSRSPISVIRDFRTDGPCPTPQNLSVNQLTATTVQLRWTASSEASSFEVEYRRIGGSGWTTIAPVFGDAVPISGLNPETRYEVRIRSVCGPNRFSTYAQDTFQTLAVGCTVPADIAVTRFDAVEWAIAWTGAADATSYTLEYRLLPDGAFIGREITTGTRDTLRGLNPFAAYQVRIRSNCIDDRQSDFSPPVLLPAFPCGNIGPVEVLNRQATSVRLGWQPFLSGEGYQLTVRNLNTFSLFSLVIADPTINVFDLTGLEPGTRYNVVVEVLPLASCPGTLVEFTTLGENNNACPAPIDLRITQPTPSQALLTWTRLPGVPSYELSYRPVDRATWTTIPGVSGPTFLVQPLIPNTRYIFRLRSSCNLPNAPFSEYVIDSVPRLAVCPPPANLLLTNLSPSAVDVSWTTQPNVPDYEVQYRAANAANWTLLAPVGAPPVRLSNLQPNTLYTVRVRSRCNGIDQEAFSAFVVQEFTTPAAAACAVPSGISASNLTATTVLVQWNGVAGAIGYVLEYRQLNTSSSIGRTLGAFTRDTLVGLLPNVSYEVRVRALCLDDQESAFTAWLPFTTGTPCPPVSNLQVSPAQNSALVSWTPVSGATGYTLEWRIRNRAAFNVLSVVNPAVSTATLPALLADTPYQVRIRTNCGPQHSGFGAWVDFRTTAAPVCQLPATIALEPQATNVLVSWTPVAGALGYEIEYRRLNATVWTRVAVSGGNTSSARIVGLTADTAYELRLRTVCSFGNSPFSAEEIFVTGRIDPSQCPAPLNLTVQAGLDRATISWLAAPNALGYDVEWREISELNFRVVPVNGPTNTTLVLQPLDPNRTYLVQVVTRCPNGNSRPTTPVEFTTRPGPCPTPTGVTVVPQLTSATLSWQAQSGVIGYEIEWREANASFTRIETINNPAQTSFVLLNLTANRSYEFTVASICSDGFSAPSARQEFTTGSASCAAPVNLQVRPGRTTATLTFSLPPNATGSVIRYRALNSTRPPVSFTLSVVTSSFQMTGLQPNTEYEFSISTRCGSETSGPATITYRTLPAARELNPTAQEADFSLTVYPNPNRGRFTLQLQGLAQQAVPVQLVDLAGRNLWRTVLYPTGDRFDYDIAPDGLSAGLYLLRVSTPTGDEVVKVIVQ